MKPTTLIFDWHGVLDTVTFEKFTQKTSLPVEKIRKIIHEDERAYTAGLIEPAQFWLTVKQKLKVPNVLLEKIKSYITDCQPNQALWDLLPQLKKTYRLAILSDCPADKLAVIREKTDLSFFEAAHFSCDKHTFKANDDFFLNLVRELKVAPAECLYIDDSPKHIAAAEKLGFKTYHWNKDVNTKLFLSFLNK